MDADVAEQRVFASSVHEKQENVPISIHRGVLLESRSVRILLLQGASGSGDATRSSASKQ